MKRIVNHITIFGLLSCQVSVKCGLTQSDSIVTLPDAFYYNLTTTSRADVFLTQNQRQFTATTNEQEERLNDFKNLYNKRIEVLAYNEELLETKLSELENKLNPLELLSDIADFCVQKYRSKLPIRTQIRTNFAACLQKANAAYQPIVAVPQTSFNNLKSYYVNTFSNALKDCTKKFELLESNYTTCVVNAVKTTTGVTNTNMFNFNNQMKSAHCQADLKVKESFDCYNNVLTTGLGAISEISALVENCMTGHELCPTCLDDGTIQRGRCPYQMSWHLAENDLSSEKITNPFKGINIDTPCLQINFINKSVQLQ